jgi:hypothetical protein
MQDQPEKVRGFSDTDIRNPETRRRGICRVTMDVATAAAAIVGVLMATEAVRWQRARTNLGIGLEIPENALNLGIVWTREDFNINLPISNTTDNPIEITEFKTSCDCTIKTGILTVPAHGTSEVNLTADLFRFFSAEAGGSESPFAVSLVPVVKPVIRGQVPRWVIQGTTRNIFVNAPTHIDFAESCVYGEDYPTQEIQLVARRSLHSVRVECAASPNCCQLKSSAGSPTQFSLEIRPAGSLPIGRFQYAARLYCRVEDLTEFCAAEIPVFGYVVSDVNVKPSMLLAGVVEEGVPLEYTLWLQSRSGKTWSVNANGTDGIQLEPNSVQVGSQEATLQMRMIPMRGHQSASVYVCVQQASVAHTIEIPVKYVGIECE